MQLMRHRLLHFLVRPNAAKAIPFLEVLPPAVAELEPDLLVVRELKFILSLRTAAWRQITGPLILMVEENWAFTQERRADSSGLHSLPRLRSEIGDVKKEIE